MNGKKYDSGKLRWCLLPLKTLEPIIKVLMHGSEKYEDYNWQKVPNAKERYYDALMRHITEYQEGARIDKDSGLSVLGHIGCCVIFLIWFELKGDKK